ncbi:VOC family protein [Nocardioides sp. GY 10127]|uniref:VOC family protein n=1 Tax=Nocardioides sp. GY 10127 TaxID=2569762 RepID=UPI0010A81928|nr:VOC family protein [Nocardioides sp. GY 10127]TIC80002.1 VOC family protein [Nocardioides sp. GY 10127]
MCAQHASPSLSSAPSPDSTATVTVDHVGISVRDLEGLATFYGSVFSLTEEFRFTVEEAGLSAVVLRSDAGWGIELLHRADSTTPARWTSPDEAVRSQGLGHLCLRVTDDLDDLYERLLAAGGSPVVTPRIGPHPQVRMSYAADPEGNLIEMISFLEGFGS